MFVFSAKARAGIAYEGYVMRKTIFLVVLAAGLFVVAGLQHNTLVKMRSVYRLDSVDYVDNAPPVVALTMVALGGFRGLLADVLWLRISYLQEKGDYFELVQLSDWVTNLEPRNTEAWSFHAWNMAYNISVMMAEPEDKWRWVLNGIRLLRDEGIAYNPGDPELYRQLGWLFQHKIGSNIDLSHEYYKDRWAEMMGELFEGPRPDYTNLSDFSRLKMIKEYKLDPETMQAIESKYGPLDWRIPEAHSLYWAYRGLKYCEANKTFLYDAMIRQSLEAMVENKQRKHPFPRE